MAEKTLNISGSLLNLSTPLIMGIVNITPDSFFSDSRKQTETEIVTRCQQIIDEGGTILDVGAQSSAPTSTLLSAKEEVERLIPALKRIRKEFPDAVLSVDTFYADVARQAVEEFGANIINDVSGGQMDERMFSTVAQLNVPYILTHFRGTPQTMQSLTDYDNLIQDVLYYFSEQKAKLNLLGVNDVILDPGFGFGKTLNQNYELMANLKYFHIFDEPILVGISRKSMIYNLLNTSPQESLNGTTVLNTVALQSGASILRVHDVREAVQCVKIAQQLKN